MDVNPRLLPRKEEKPEPPYSKDGWTHFPIVLGRRSLWPIGPAAHPEVLIHQRLNEEAEDVLTYQDGIYSVRTE